MTINKIKSTQQKFTKIKEQDTELYKILQAEQKRQTESLSQVKIL